MKNLIIILSVILLSSCALHRKQEGNTGNSKYNKTGRYKPLDKFRGDTLAFIQHSILDRKEYYFGKELRVLLRDLSIPISVYSFSNLPNDINSSNHINLNINNYYIQRDKLAKHEDPITLVIIWKKNIDYNEFDAISKKNSYQWTPEVEQYLSDKIVGNIVKTDYKLKKQ